MKESDITPEVINLAKQLTEYWRMEIYEGCWFITDYDDYPGLCHDLYRLSNSMGEIIPVPSISDCLEKLREFPEDNVRLFYDVEPPLWVVFVDEYKPSQIMEESQSLHLALLSALLEVLKNE